MAILILRDSARGTGATGYAAGDVIGTAEDTDTVTMPPTAPFVVLKVTGLTVEQVEQYLEKGTTAKKNYFVDPSKMTAGQRNYLATRRHLGFLADAARYGAEVADDVTITTAQAASWITRKA